MTAPPIVQSKPRHRICELFDGFLDVIIADQNTGDSNAAEAMRLEWGESLASGIMQAAGLRRVRLHNERRSKARELHERNGTPKTTGASS